MSGPTDLYLSNAILLSDYNRYFNQVLDRLLEPPEVVMAPVLTQLNHIYVMDHLWLGRLGLDHPAIEPPLSMDEARFHSFEAWRPARRRTDAILDSFVRSLTQARVYATIGFVTEAEGLRVTCSAWAALTHLFNHQSLHRGEILGLLSAQGIHFGNGDLLPLIIQADGPIAEVRAK